MPNAHTRAAMGDARIQRAHDLARRIEGDGFQAAIRPWMEAVQAIHRDRKVSVRKAGFDLANRRIVVSNSPYLPLAAVWELQLSGVEVDHA